MTWAGGVVEGGEGASLALLLTQALHARDEEKVELVLAEAEESRQRATVAELPLPLCLPFLAAIHKRIANRVEWDRLLALLPSPTLAFVDWRIRNLLRWLQITLQIHMSFLTSVAHPSPICLPCATFAPSSRRR